MTWHFSLWHLIGLAVIAVVCLKITRIWPPGNGGDGGRYA
jgi:hypothetical protein